MKLLICLLVLLTSSTAFTYSCPDRIDKRKQAQATHQYLEKFKGRYQLGVCQVEITTCDFSEESVNGNPIAEVFLLDQYGREVYLSLEYPEQESWYLKTKTKWNDVMLNYRKRDRHYEEELGRTEHYRLEILSDWNDVNTIDSIHLGVYSTNNQLNQWNGNDSTWSICERE